MLCIISITSFCCAKKSFLSGHPFFNIRNVFCAKHGWGMLVHAPGWSLAIASIEVIPPKVSFFAPKNDIFNKGCAPTFEKSHTQNTFLLFWLFLSVNFVRPISTLANNKRSGSKKWKISACQNCVFSLFPAKLLARFVTPFSTFASIKGSLPTCLTTLERLR